jgi:hypothetical protein
MEQNIIKCPMCDGNVEFSHGIYTCPGINVYKCSNCDWFYEQEGTDGIKILSLVEGIAKRPQMYEIDHFIKMINETDLAHILKDGMIERLDNMRCVEDEFLKDFSENHILICESDFCFSFLESKGYDIEKIKNGCPEYEQEDFNEKLREEFIKVCFPFIVETEDAYRLCDGRTNLRN